jgi:hypothetical protein
MEAGFDALGNIVGRYAAADPHAPVVMTGSHRIACATPASMTACSESLPPSRVRDLHDRGKRLPYTLEVVGFATRRVRFGATLIGSKAMAEASSLPG